MATITGIYWCLVLVDLILLSSATELVQTSPPYTPLCPGDELVLTCVTYTGNTYWQYRAMMLDTIRKLQNVVSAVIINRVLILNVTDIVGNTVTSTATIPSVNASMNGTMASCSNQIVSNSFVTFTIKMTGNC